MIDELDIQTTQTKNEQTVQSVYSPTEIQLSTTVQAAPQVQTVIQPYASPIVSIVDAPWVTVTSVNGMTGDVVVELTLGEFQPNHLYKKNTAILHDGNLAFALNDFTSGSTYSPSDWGVPTFVQEQANWNENDTTANSYIKNKPTKVSDFTNDQQYQTKTQLDSAVQGLETSLDDKVDKVSGMGLSSNDYTTTEKTKLAGIASGAEVNVQSDWGQNDNAQDDFIKNKPSIPTKTSDLTNDSDFTTSLAVTNAINNTSVIIDLNIDGATFFGQTASSWTFSVPKTGYWELCNPFTVTCYEQANSYRYLWLNLDNTTTRETCVFGYTYDAVNSDNNRGDTRRQLSGTSRVISLTAGTHTITKHGWLPVQWRSDYNTGMCYPQLFLRWVGEVV